MRPFAPGTWRGEDRLVVGIDIGTTYSAVSYACLYTGGAQEISRVGKWPGQPGQKGTTKIPSVLYYDSKENPTLCGAEAITADAQDEARENGWQLAKHFKLHLHPEELRLKHNLKVDKIPFHLTVEKIYSDFIRYLLVHTRAFFEDRTPNGRDAWLNLIEYADFVLAHPNGWGLKEQSVLRRAAIQADLVRPSDADTRIHFVTEAEASAHFCVVNAHLAMKFKTGTNFVICDAGGSTVDITSYVVKQCRPTLILHEAKASGCTQAGGIFVNQEAMEQLRNQFGKAGVPTELMNDWLVAAEHEFETSLKPEFPRPTGRHSLAVERPSYNNKDAGIKNGRLALTVDTVTSFFEPCLRQIKDAMSQQLHDFNAQHILIVGGFGDSLHLQQEFKTAFSSSSCEVNIVDDGTSKAVSDGAVIWQCLQAVDSRVTRCSFGISVDVLYDRDDPSHQGRKKIVSLDGRTKVGDQWRNIVDQDTLIKDDVKTSTRANFESRAQAREILKTFTQTLYSYSGVPPSKEFVRDSRDRLARGFQPVCEIVADMSPVAKSLQPRNGLQGQYYRAEYDVGVTFGGTELKAFIEWNENGVVRRGPATVIPAELR